MIDIKKIISMLIDKQYIPYELHYNTAKGNATLKISVQDNSYSLKGYTARVYRRNRYNEDVFYSVVNGAFRPIECKHGILFKLDYSRFFGNGLNYISGRGTVTVSSACNFCRESYDVELQFKTLNNEDWNTKNNLSSMIDAYDERIDKLRDQFVSSINNLLIKRDSDIHDVDPDIFSEERKKLEISRKILDELGSIASNRRFLIGRSNFDLKKQGEEEILFLKKEEEGCEEGS